MHAANRAPDIDKVPEGGPECYIWNARGAPLRVVVWSQPAGRMRLESGEKAEKGTAAGLLLGSTEAGLVTVEDVAPVSWPRDLSAGERRELETAMAAATAARPVVGFYRTQGGDELFLNAVDLALIQTYFPDPAQVFLLLKGATSDTLSGRYFFRQNGRMLSESSLPGMPFGRPVFGAQGALLAAEAVPPAAEEEYQAGEPTRLSRVGKTLLWTAVGIVACGIAYSYLAGARRGAVATPAAPAAQQLSLSVERRPGDLVLHWEGAAAAIAGARRAVLVVEDGAFRKPYDLDPDQLRTGRIYYTPQSSDVRFRLEVYGEGERPVVESVRVLSSLPEWTPGEPENPGIPRFRESTQRTGRAPETAAPPRLQYTPTAPAAAPVPLEAPPALDQPAVRPAVGVAVPGTSRALTVAAPVPPAGKPAAPASADKPAAEPAPVRVSSYTGPRPIHEVQPNLPPTVRATMRGSPEISVRVYVDARGRVTGATLAGQTGAVGPWIAQATLDAARGWRFQPATSGGQPISSSVVLNFRFVR